MGVYLSWDVESDLYGSTVHAFKKKKRPVKAQKQTFEIALSNKLSELKKTKSAGRTSDKKLLVCGDITPHVAIDTQCNIFGIINVMFCLLDLNWA